VGGAAVEGLPGWVTLLRAPNPGPMTLDGTNTWVLRAPGAAEAVVIDPGPLDHGHLTGIAGYAPVSSILVTHGHHDHVEGAAELSRMLGGVPVRAADARHCVGSEPLTPGVRTEAGLEIEVLALLSAYPRMVLPGHGPVRPDCGELARAYLAHRRERLDQVRAAVADGADTPEAVVDAVYTDLDPAVRFAAIWSTRAQLEYLRRESQPVPEQLDPL